jgi:hypothetical protein
VAGVPPKNTGAVANAAVVGVVPIQGGYAGYVAASDGEHTRSLSVATMVIGGVLASLPSFS